MLVSPIEETADESLSQSGETGKAEEGREAMEESEEAMEEKEEEEESSVGRKSVGRKSPEGADQSRKRRSRKDALPLWELVRALCQGESQEQPSQKACACGASGRGQSAQSAYGLLLHEPRR